MATYTPQGFNNAGATPGQDPTKNNTVGTNLNLGALPKGLSLGYTAPTTGTVKKSTYTDPSGGSITHTYDTTSGTTGGSTGGTTSGVLNNNNGNGLTPDQIAAGNTFTNNANAAAVPTFPGLLGNISDTAKGNLGIGQNAANIAQNYGQQISDIGQKGAAAQAGYKTTGTSPVGEGNAAVIGQTTAAQQQAAAAGETAALQGTQQQLTGQNQAASAYTGAANLAQPVTQFGVLTNPTNGQSVSPNPGASAFQGGYVQGQQAAGTNAAGMDVANTAATGIKNTITDYLTQNPTLNANDLTFGNTVTQWINGQQLGDPKYQTLFNDLSEYANTLAPILGVGGNVTNMKNQIAQDMINAKASGKSITEVLNNLEQLAKDKVSNIKSGGQGGGVVAGGSTGGASTQPVYNSNGSLQSVVF